MPTAEVESVHVLWYRVLAEMPAIGKNQQNKEQGFAFRGHDDVMNALNPILSKYGVFVVPNAMERIATTRQTNRGSTMYEVNLHVSFTVYGPAGDSFTGSAWGEGTDMGDKATNKAMTGAFKYWLAESLALSTREISEADADRYTPEETNTDADSVACGVCGGEIPGARSSREPMRDHMAEAHSWIRLADGSVVSPTSTAGRAAAGAQAVARGSSARPEPPAAPADEPAAPAPEPAAPTAPVADESEAPADDEDQGDDEPPEDVSWVDDLKGDALAEKAKEFGVALSGKKAAEVRAAIKEYLLSNPIPGAAADLEAPDEPGPVGQFQCPDCNAFPFVTQEEYEEHWTKDHGGGGEDEGGTDTGADDTSGDDDGPADPADIEDIKGRIGSLAGESARAYGKYRREHNIGRPDALNAGQAAELLVFLDSLG